MLKLDIQMLNIQFHISHSFFFNIFRLQDRVYFLVGNGPIRFSKVVVSECNILL